MSIEDDDEIWDPTRFDTKSVAVYGIFVTYKPVYQRYWIKRKDGIIQRYWKKTSRLQRVATSEGRFEFWGTGRELWDAVLTSREYVPRGYVEASADAFLANPYHYTDRGYWVDWKVES